MSKLGTRGVAGDAELEEPWKRRGFPRREGPNSCPQAGVSKLVTRSVLHPLLESLANFMSAVRFQARAARARTGARAPIVPARPHARCSIAIPGCVPSRSIFVALNVMIMRPASCSGMMRMCEQEDLTFKIKSLFKVTMRKGGMDGRGRGRRQTRIAKPRKEGRKQEGRKDNTWNE